MLTSIDCEFVPLRRHGKLPVIAARERAPDNKTFVRCKQQRMLTLKSLEERDSLLSERRVCSRRCDHSLAIEWRSIKCPRSRCKQRCVAPSDVSQGRSHGCSHLIIISTKSRRQAAGVLRREVARGVDVEGDPASRERIDRPGA